MRETKSFMMMMDANLRNWLSVLASTDRRSMTAEVHWLIEQELIRRDLTVPSETSTDADIVVSAPDKAGQARLFEG